MKCNYHAAKMLFDYITNIFPNFLCTRVFFQQITNSTRDDEHRVSTTSTTLELPNRVKRHICEFCNKGFEQKRTLVAHRRIHTGEKPYKCPICNAAFTQATHRSGHIKTHDPTYRPFKCDQCGRSFARKYSLTMHSYIHKGIFPFKCKHCDKKFRQAADMRKHEQRHTVHDALICQQCGLKFASKDSLKHHRTMCKSTTAHRNPTSSSQLPMA